MKEFEILRDVGWLTYEIIENLQVISYIKDVFKILRVTSVLVRKLWKQISFTREELLGSYTNNSCCPDCSSDMSCS